MNKKEYAVIRYDIDAKFYVEVIELEEITEFWLCANNYGVKGFMFGLEKEICNCTYDHENYINKTVYWHIYDFIKEHLKIEW